MHKGPRTQIIGFRGQILYHQWYLGPKHYFWGPWKFRGCIYLAKAPFYHAHVVLLQHSLGRERVVAPVDQAGINRAADFWTHSEWL